MINVLIVEDEILIAENIKNKLQKEGSYNVEIALDYDEALVLINQHLFDISLIDISLRGSKTGIEVAQYIRTYHDMPIIFVTSHTDEKTLYEAKKIHPDGYLAKPYNFNSLKATIEITFSNYCTIASENCSKHLLITEGRKKYNFPIQNIIYIQSEHVYVNFIQTDKTIPIRSKLIDVEKKLPNHIFFRINRRTIINKNFITLVGQTYIEVNNIKLSIEKKYLVDLNKKISN